MRPKPQTYPANPIEAVTHPDPYPYYAELVARTPIYHDETLGLWIASSASAVMAVLTSDLCRVRPTNEPVPRSLLGSPAADIFRHLVRMNDGQGHCPFKNAVVATLEALDTAQAAEQSEQWARILLDEIGSHARMPDFAFHLPVYVIASLLGVPQDRLHQIAIWTGDFVRCLAPASSPEQIERGKAAAGDLLALFRTLLVTQRGSTASGLLAALAREAKLAGQEDINVIVANGIGFLSQAYEATAGLIGNTLVLLASHRDAREQVMADPGILRQVIEEVLRYDPPVQNTRRFLTGDGVVAGQEMKDGEAILVLLAAANRDPSANPNPEQFDISRKHRQIFTFGAGAHACPGDSLASTIAKAGVAQVIASGISLDQLAEAVTYHNSANVRISLLSWR